MPVRPESIRMLARAGFFSLGLAALWFSLADVRQTPGMELTWDKLNHCLGYFLLIASADLGFRAGRNLTGKSLLVVAYSFLLEVAQQFLPYREFSLLDLAANVAGVVLFLVLRTGLERMPLYRDLKRIDPEDGVALSHPKHQVADPRNEP